MDFRFTPEEEAFRQEVHDFIENECPKDLRGGGVNIMEEVGNLFERGPARQIVDVVAAVGQAAVLPVQIAQPGLGGHDALETPDELRPFGHGWFPVVEVQTRFTLVSVVLVVRSPPYTALGAARKGAVMGDDRARGFAQRSLRT